MTSSLAPLFPNPPTLFAHRGFHQDGLPENSLAAFVAAGERGYGIELDATLCGDGELVVFHDEFIAEQPFLEPGQGLSGRLHDLSSHKIRQLRFRGTGETVPSLDEALDVIGEETPLIIEVKIRDIFNRALAEASATALIELIRKRGWNSERTLYASFHPFVLMSLRRQAQELKRAFIIESYSEHSPLSRSFWKPFMTRLPFRKQAAPDVVMAEHTLLTPALAERYRAQGLTLLPWLTEGRGALRSLPSPGDSEAFEDCARRLFELPVSGLITDFPRQAEAIKASC